MVETINRLPVKMFILQRSLMSVQPIRDLWSMNILLHQYHSNFIFIKLAPYTKITMEYTKISLFLIRQYILFAWQLNHASCNYSVADLESPEGGGGEIWKSLRSAAIYLWLLFTGQGGGHGPLAPGPATVITQFLNGNKLEVQPVFRNNLLSSWLSSRFAKVSSLGKCKETHISDPFKESIMYEAVYQFSLKYLIIIPDHRKPS